MKHPDHDPVRELIEQARKLRHREQPPPELFEAALGRLIGQQLGRQQLVGEHSRRFSLPRALSALRHSLGRLDLARLGFALALALAVIGSWGARRHAAPERRQDVPNVALGAEPTPLSDATRELALGAPTKPSSVVAAAEEERVKTLEARLRSAQQRIEALEAELAAERVREPDTLHADQARDETSSNTTAGKKTGKTTGEKRGARGRSPEQPAGPPRADCKQPLFIDARGIRRIKPKCL